MEEVNVEQKCIFTKKDKKLSIKHGQDQD